MESSTCRRSRAGRVESDGLEVDREIGTGQSRRAENLSWVAGGWVPQAGSPFAPQTEVGRGKTSRRCYRMIGERF